MEIQDAERYRSEKLESCITVYLKDKEKQIIILFLIYVIRVTYTVIFHSTVLQTEENLT